MNQFDRSQSPYSHSLPFYRFRRDLRDISEFHWASRLAGDELLGEVKTHPADAVFDQTWNLPQERSRRYPRYVRDLAPMTKNAAAWRRRLTLIAMSSALERYMASIAEIAVASDPLLLPGFPKLLDGAILHAHGVDMIRPTLRGLTNGDWTARSSTYKSLFKCLPSNLDEQLDSLEKLRRNRNKIAHSMGFDNNYEAGTTENFSQIILDVRGSGLSTAGRVEVSEEQVAKLLQAVDRAAEAVDSHLLTDYIGSYEVVQIYLDWRRGKDAFEAAAGLDAPPHVRGYPDHKRFKRLVCSILDARAVSESYARQLISYAEQL